MLGSLFGVLRDGRDGPEGRLADRLAVSPLYMMGMDMLSGGTGAAGVNAAVNVQGQRLKRQLADRDIAADEEQRRAHNAFWADGGEGGRLQGLTPSLIAAIRATGYRHAPAALADALGKEHANNQSYGKAMDLERLRADRAFGLQAAGHEQQLKMQDYVFAKQDNLAKNQMERDAAAAQLKADAAARQAAPFYAMLGLGDAPQRQPGGLLPLGAPAQTPIPRQPVQGAPTDTASAVRTLPAALKLSLAMQAAGGDAKGAGHTLGQYALREDKGREAYDVADAKHYAQVADDLRKSETTGLAEKMQRLSDIVASGNYTSGVLSPVWDQIVRQTNPERAANNTEFDKTVGMLRGLASKDSGIPTRTNFENAQLAKLVPDRNTSAAEVRRMTQVWQSVARRDAAINALAEEYKAANNGRLDWRFNSLVNEHVKNNPLFDPPKTAAPTGGDLVRKPDGSWVRRVPAQ